MTKEQKILLLLILLVAGGGAVLYITTAKQSQTQEVSTVPAASNEAVGSAASETVSSLPSGSQPAQQQNEAKAPESANAAPSTISIPYVSEQTYNVPENSRETIKVTLYVKSGLVQDVVFSFNPPSKRESAEYLSSFKKALAKTDLKGKKVSEINLSRVGGASLTTAAFMKAVQEINGKTGA